MKKFALRFVSTCGLAAAAAVGIAQSWSPLAHQPPWAPSTMFLLTDGSILLQRDYPNGQDWAKLVPDINGNYSNGTWVNLADAHYTRLYYASGVFADGRVIVCGGEYSNGGSETNKTEIYDPIANTWTNISAPPGWANVGDAPSAILADGRFFVGSIFNNKTAFYDPTNGTWTAGPNKADPQGTEESWSILWDRTVLALEAINHPNTERWLPTTNAWQFAGQTPQNLVLPGSYEVGGLMTLMDGRAFAIGGTPHTALYTQPNNINDQGTWAPGPDTPLIGGRLIGAEDAPCCLMPNGQAMLALGPVTVNGGTFEAPTFFFIYDPTTNALTQITAPANSQDVPYNGRFMILPTGQVLFAAQGQIQIYTPSGGPDASWRPTISACPSNVNGGGSYTIQGTQFNGRSIAVGYGDEAGIGTNYPIVRIKNNATGHVFYCRTHDHSTMAIGTGSTTVATNFDVPAGIENGPATLEVVANGIASTPFTLTVGESTTTIPPSSYTFIRGAQTSGNLASLRASDDDRLVGINGFVANSGEFPILLEVKASSSSMNPTTLKFVAETSAETPNLNQRLWLFNYATGAFEEIDSRMATTSDATVTITVTGDLSRFVNQSTGEIKARVGMRPAGLLSRSRWHGYFDLINWVEG